MHGSVRALAALGGALVGLASLAGGLATPPAEAFPAEQLARGEEVWATTCNRCHGPESDNPDAPLLLRQGSLKNYANAADLFHYVRESMPSDEPGSLADEQYWDVLAFLIDRQGILTSDVPLGPDNARDVQTSPP